MKLGSLGPTFNTPRAQNVNKAPLLRFASSQAGEEHVSRMQRIDHVYHFEKQDILPLIPQAISLLKPGEKIIIGRSETFAKESLAQDPRIAKAFVTTASDPKISRRHLQIERKGNNLYAKDLGSNNGTMLICKAKGLTARQENVVHITHMSGEVPIAAEDRLMVSMPLLAFPIPEFKTIQRIDQINLEEALDKPSLIADEISRLKNGEKIVIGSSHRALEFALKQDSAIIRGFRTTKKDPTVERAHVVLERQGSKLIVRDVSHTRNTRIFQSADGQIQYVTPGGQQEALPGHTLSLGEGNLSVTIPRFVS